MQNIVSSIGLFCKRALWLVSQGTVWPRRIGCLIFTGYFPQTIRMIRGSFAERDLQLKAYESYVIPHIYTPTGMYLVSFIGLFCKRISSLYVFSLFYRALLQKNIVSLPVRVYICGTHTHTHTQVKRRYSFAKEPYKRDWIHTTYIYSHRYVFSCRVVAGYSMAKMHRIVLECLILTGYFPQKSRTIRGSFVLMWYHIYILTGMYSVSFIGLFCKRISSLL